MISTFLLAPEQFISKKKKKNQALHFRSSITLLKGYNSRTYLGVFINGTETGNSINIAAYCTG